MAMALPLLLILLLGAPAIYAVEYYTVGDSKGWTNNNVNYSSWATGKTFMIGDILVFTYGSSHQVDLVNQTGYTNCATSNNVIKSFTTGNDSIPLTSVGQWYFICPKSNHCSTGQKLAINVTVATTTPSGTPPTTVVTTSPPPPNSGVAGSFGHMSNWMLGFSLVVAIVVMGFLG